ncbi:Hypothetical protein SCF082_LOCUS33418 [Durusdinium trenchii]|uniref:Uncharacterized protein n=1 Tax=Durusdinium trenchii TaxID=1381693 RepID=A0ABP0NQY2_9DINO
MVISIHPTGSCEVCRAFASDAVTASVDAVTTGGDPSAVSGEELLPWLAPRRSQRPPRQEQKGQTVPKRSKELDLVTAEVPEILEEAVSVAYSHPGTPEAHDARDARWRQLVERLSQVELSAEQAFVVFHCMVKTDDFETKLFERVVDRLECRYFSMELGSKLEDLPKRDGQVVAYILRAFLQNDEENVSFQSLVNEMPLSHTVQLILRSGRGFPTRGGPVKPAMPAPEPDAKRRWKTMDPVEMEALERERFFKGRWKVLRMPYVEAQVTRMPPGKRLRASLASQLFQVLPNAAPATLAEIAQVCFFDERLLTGDLNFDFQEALAKRICSLNRHELLPYILAFCAAMRHCEGPNAYRAWRKKLLPDLLWLLRATKRSEVLENQQFIRPLMRWDPQPGFQHYLAETCARLLISVAGARQVQMDVELLDALAAPLEDLLEKWLKSEEEVPADGAARRSPLSPETMSDVLSVCVTCKVRPKSLPQLMAQLVEQDLGAQPSPERSERWTLPELCVTAHGLALLCENAQVPLQRLWQVAQTHELRQASAALQLQLMDALLRGASDELLKEETLRNAIDEFLVQRMDFELSALGHIGT